MKEFTVGLFNDSFPPTIDGVASVTLNYAKKIQEKYGEAIVATPYYPDVQDAYPFEVLRYPSVYIGDTVGYRAGYPFDPKVLHELEHRHIDIIHAHSPFVSTVLARMLRNATGAPIVFTYHTKFDVDIEKIMASDSLRRASIKFILSNINACDEVWVVSEGAGENLRSLGYKGDYIVMENGTDFEKKESDPARVDKLRRQHGIDARQPVFLFVGRMMWYKGIRISLDGLRALKEAGEDFRFIMVGDGADRAEIEDYIREIGLGDDCILTGAIRVREVLRDYFTLADLFLFPSSFDTNGIVVREAAACSCPSVILAGSAAAEGILGGQNGILIEENAAAMAEVLLAACKERGRLRKIGENAADQLYISWDDAVEKAYSRYEKVLERQVVAEAVDADSLNEALTHVLDRIVDDISAARNHLDDIYIDTKNWISANKEENREYYDMRNQIADEYQKTRRDALREYRDKLRKLREERKERRKIKKLGSSAK